MTSLLPGIVANTNPDGTYDVVQLESGTLLPNQAREQFRAYHTYAKGTRAAYEASRNEVVAVTVVGFLRGSAPPGLEINGSYRFTVDGDPSREVVERPATRMHRLAGFGDDWSGTAGSGDEGR